MEKLPRFRMEGYTPPVSLAQERRNLVRTLHAVQGFSQSQVAEKLGISQARVCQIMGDIRRKQKLRRLRKMRPPEPLAA